MKLYKTPHYLIILLKRYEQDTGSINSSFFGNQANYKKKDKYVNYPVENLDLSDYVQNHDSPLIWENQSNKKPNQPPKYEEENKNQHDE